MEGLSGKFCLIASLKRSSLSTELISSQFPSSCDIFIKSIDVSQVKLVKT